MSGVEHLMVCLEMLQDLGAQLLGDPESAIAAIRRSGELVPSPQFLGDKETFEQREAVAGAKIAMIHKRRVQRDAVDAAIAVIQDTVRELSKAQPVAERLAARL